MAPYTNLNDTFVQKIIHVKDDQFVIQYMGGLIELRDLSKEEEPLLSYQVDHESDPSLEFLVDIDMKGDETNLLLAFKDYKVGWLNLRSSEFRISEPMNVWEGYISMLFV